MPKDTELHKAAYRGEVLKVEELIAEGEDINSRGAANRTPLHRAVGEGHTQVVELLIKHGADVHIKDGSGRTPLHWAAVSGSLETAQLLHKKNADVNCTTNSGSTPLHMASEACKAPFVAWLISVSANIELRDGPAGDGQTAYEMAKARKNKEVMALLKPTSTNPLSDCIASLKVQCAPLKNLFLKVKSKISSKRN